MAELMEVKRVNSDMGMMVAHFLPDGQFLG